MTRTSPTADFGPHASSATIAVLGATGLVGRAILDLLHGSGIGAAQVRALASGRGGRRTLAYGADELEVQAVSREAFEGVDLVLASAGGDVSREWLPVAAELGAVCVDNTSAFRMDASVPLVVPEVNAHALAGITLGRGAIIANPNCSTIQLVAALEPLRRAVGLRRVLVSTYQSIAGAGRRALEDFREASTVRLESMKARGALVPDAPHITDAPRVPAFDAVPLIGECDAEGHTSEEIKMVRETPKILGAGVPVDVTCVRVPVFVGHAESVVVETDEPITPERARELFRAAAGVDLWPGDDAPTPSRVAGDRGVHVGRIRPSNTFERGLQFWVVADNLLKGAAWNAVQIAADVVRRSDAPVRA